MAGNRLTGSPTAIPEAEWRAVRGEGIQWQNNPIGEIQECAEFMIEHAVAEQRRLNEAPSLAGGTDVIVITSRTGVEKVRYEPHCPPAGKRPLAETHYHYLGLAVGAEK
jgi:hypothetical protein